jgi:hypothetical protein
VGRETIARYWALGVGAVALVVVECAAGIGAGGRTALILPSEHVSDAWADSHVKEHLYGGKA